MIEMDDIALHYRMAGTRISVLQGLSLHVETGERVAIIGPSGSGKTSLLLLLTGLAEADEGSIRIGGAALGELSADQRADLRRRDIGIVFQSFHLIPNLTAVENVALPLDIGGIANSRQRGSAMLERVGLGARGQHYPSQLSGGEQQRVAMARALVHEPRLLVADEPTGNLDEQTGNDLMQTLFDLNRQTGVTLLLVTHDPELASRCDRTLRLHDGRLHND